MNVQERYEALDYAVEGIELTPAIEELLELLALERSPEDVATLCDLFGRLRRGAMPEINLDESVGFAKCRSGFTFVGEDTEDAVRAHDRFCPVCGVRGGVIASG